MKTKAQTKGKKCIEMQIDDKSSSALKRRAMGRATLLYAFCLP
jgi:hypothetical protein